jgi:hypothetical protein
VSRRHTTLRKLVMLCARPTRRSALQGETRGRLDAAAGVYRSSGVKPVRFAIRASIFGPISSSSWEAKTTSDQFERASVRWEPDGRLTLQPNSFEFSEEAPRLRGRPVSQAARNVTFRNLAGASRCSSRSAIGRIAVIDVARHRRTGWSRHRRIHRVLVRPCRPAAGSMDETR